MNEGPGWQAMDLHGQWVSVSAWRAACMAVTGEGDTPLRLVSSDEWQQGPCPIFSDEKCREWWPEFPF